MSREDVTNDLTYHLLGCSLLQIRRPFWAVRINDTGHLGKDWISEAHVKSDIYHGTMRLTDWTADLVANELTPHIKELWMFCPPGPVSPFGNTARLPILIPGTAFQFKVGMHDSSGGHGAIAHLIGRVNDPATGECSIFLYDCIQQALYEPQTTTIRDLDAAIPGNAGRPWKQNIHTGIGTWTPRQVPVLGKVAHEVLGLKGVG